MNKEFKKIIGKKITRYVLEAATGGSTSAAAVATGPTSKDNLLTQDKNQPQVQRRNPVAANVNAAVGGGGSGAHKDRKRAEKRGEQKHKKDFRRDVDETAVNEKWSDKYKRSINCSHPKGFSQRAHCQGKKKHNESVEMEMVCPDCGMCETHGNNMMEVKQRLDAKCWKGKKKQGTKIKGGIRVNNCVPKESVSEGLKGAVVGGALGAALLDPELALPQARKITKSIKYNNVPNEIMVEIEQLAARTSGIDKRTLKYSMDSVYEAINALESAVYGLEEAFEDAAREAEYRRDDEETNEGYGMSGYSTVVGSKPIAKNVPEDNVDPGYIDQENGMTTSSLKSLYKQAIRLRQLVKQMGNDRTLEPWQQEKIAKASDYVNSVFRSLDDEYGLDNLEEADKKGLWANIHARRKKGLPARKPGEKGAPSQKSWDAAVSASKKKKSVGEDNIQEYETHTYTDSQGRKWRVNDEGDKELLYDPNDRYSSKSRYSGRSYSQSSKPETLYFYAVPTGHATKAFELGLKRSKSGKWYSKTPNERANFVFGPPKAWTPKTEESMMPASHFAGTPKNKLGPAAHLKGKMKRPAQQGDLVGGSAEESFEKKKDIEEKLNPADPVDVWVDDFLDANPERYHQFRNKNRPGTRKPDAYIVKMAKAASYRAKTGKR